MLNVESYVFCGNEKSRMLSKSNNKVGKTVMCCQCGHGNGPFEDETRNFLGSWQIFRNVLTL